MQSVRKNNIDSKNDANKLKCTSFHYICIIDRKIGNNMDSNPFTINIFKNSNSPQEDKIPKIDSKSDGALYIHSQTHQVLSKLLRIHPTFQYVCNLDQKRSGSKNSRSKSIRGIPNYA